MRFYLSIDLENDAMLSPDDVAGALSALATQFSNTTEPFDTLPHSDRVGIIRDANGLRVGMWEVRES
jgi:uncharacterized protein involved in tellurium resistance